MTMPAALKSTKRLDRDWSYLLAQPSPHFSSQVFCNLRCKFGLRNTRYASLAARQFRFAVIVGEGVPCQVALSST